MNCNDIELDVATGVSAKAKSWKNKKITWSQMAKRLMKANHTNETYKEFMSANKTIQGSIKDVGGYVGGYLNGGRRKPENVMHRQLITLDIDFGELTLWDDLTLEFEEAMVLHGTHKHSDRTPRYRLVMPLDREVTPEEYQAIARAIAGRAGIELFDRTTFEVNRLMFWPSTPKDIDYYAMGQQGPAVCADDVLSSYKDWHNVSEWPTPEAESKDIDREIKRQEDPTEKKGIIGAFCRSYGIDEAIATFIPNEYTEAGEGRYTYTGGTTAAGMVTYDDLYAFSHHGTDPSGGQLCNAFDLIRLHRFGHLDEVGGKKKSMSEMELLAASDKRVKRLLAKERKEAAKASFAEFDNEEGEPTETEEDTKWIEGLDTDKNGKFLPTDKNISLIIANDKQLRGRFAFNEFDRKRYVTDSPPWRKLRDGAEPVRDVDYSGMRNYLGTIYGISAVGKIDDALALEFEKKAFHPVRDYLTSLEWDGTHRVDRLLITYFGAEDNVYTQEAIRKMLVGAVARIMRPGCKFDLSLVLVGEQGCGKSTFIHNLGMDWFSDTFTTLQGKDAFEQIQGQWIIEMGELAALRKAEVEAIKHFISKQEDTYRAAYARTTETNKRQCVFFGTTNNYSFLRDPSGNRRFMPIDCSNFSKCKSVHSDDFPTDQIWAEAVHLYEKGEPLYLSPAADKIANRERRGHSEQDDRQGMIEDYLDREIPSNWDTRDLSQRRSFLNHNMTDEDDQMVKRDHVCAAEVWCECLGKEKEDMSKFATREVNDILRSLEGWEPSKGPKRFKLYGNQRYYKRK